MRSPHHARRLVSVALLGLLTMGIAALTPVASAAPPKPFSVTVEPDCVATGEPQTFTVTVTNLSKSQSLGSADLTAPDGFTVTGATPLPDGSSIDGNTIQLRNLSLAPGESFVLSVQATTASVAGVYTWSVIAKQANNFSGPPGNDFVFEASQSDLTTILDGCTLRFDVQPASALIGAKITGTPFNPASSSKVKVTAIGLDFNPIADFDGMITLAIDPANNPGGKTLQGTTTKAASAGSATFDSIWINQYGLGYKLVASSPGFTPMVSTAFDVVDAGKACPPEEPCTLNVETQDQLSSNGTTGTVTRTFQTTGGAQGGVIQVGIGRDSIDCAGYDEHLESTVTFDITTGEAKRITIRIAKNLVNADPNNGVSFYHVCYSSPTATGVDGHGNPVAFFDRNGDPVYPDGGALTPTAGLLPDCSSAPMPCVVSRNKTRAGEVTLVFDAPQGDPKVRN